MAWQLFDYCTLGGDNAIAIWLASLDVPHRARVKAKLIAIHTFGSENELPGMVTDTVEPHVKEIVINTKSLALRLFLCRGPKDVRTELTLLGGGQEKDRKYLARPGLIDPATAETRRIQVKDDPTNRRRKHEFDDEFLG